jgi:hypothetical protein
VVGAEALQLGFELGEKPVAVAPLALGLLLVEAEDVATAALAAAEDDLLGAQAGRDGGSIFTSTAARRSCE